jgi:hypothetical protein
MATVPAICTPQTRVGWDAGPRALKDYSPKLRAISMRWISLVPS